MEYRKNLRYEILTPTGFQDFKGIKKVQKDSYIRIRFESGLELKVSNEHKLWSPKEAWVKACSLKTGDDIVGTNGLEKIASIEQIHGSIELFDAVEVADGHKYYTGNLLSSNCDCDFLSSGNSVVEPEDLTFYENTYLTEPVERRGVSGDLWLWQQPDYTRNYLISADVARGDGKDWSAFHVIDVETAEQVAEYKGKIAPRDYGDFLCGVATEFNYALLVVENASIGWSTIEEIIARGYPNLYYGSNNQMETAESYAAKVDHDRLTPGFTMSLRTRPLVIAKMVDYLHEKSAVVHSKRLLTELRTFIWSKSGKAQAQEGYNDDLVMSFGTALYVRDTALRLRQQGLDLSRAQLNTFGSLNQRKPVIYQPASFQNPYEMKDNFGHNQDISWVLK